MAVFDDGVTDTKVVSTDMKPVDEGDAIYVQHIQTEEKPNYWTKLYGDGQKLYMNANNVKFLLEIHH